MVVVPALEMDKARTALVECILANRADFRSVEIDDLVLEFCFNLA